jgi:hypothetical protein
MIISGHCLKAEKQDDMGYSPNEMSSSYIRESLPEASTGDDSILDAKETKEIISSAAFHQVARGDEPEPEPEGL